MTGRELLEHILTIPDRQLDLEVQIEGCDCIGIACGVEVVGAVNIPVAAGGKVVDYQTTPAFIYIKRENANV